MAAQEPNHLLVGRGKGIAFEFEGPDPAKGVTILRERASLNEPAFIEVEGNAAVGIPVVISFKEADGLNPNSELLKNFAFEAGAQAFRTEPFSSREFPKAS